MAYLKKNMLKIVVFGIGYIFFFISLQNILVPKFDYQNDDIYGHTGKILPGFYAEEENTLDVLILGTSSTRFGVSPMEIYREYGIKSYNLSTNGQPLEVSYFILKEALKRQEPKVVIIEAGQLFHDEEMEDGYWRTVLDTMPLSVNKYEFAKVYAERSGEQSSIMGKILPLYQYHDRWKLLFDRDFTKVNNNMEFYSKGYYMQSVQVEGGFTKEEKDATAISLNEILDNNILYEYKNDKYIEKRVNSEVNKSEYVCNNSLDWLLKIKELCRNKNIELIMVKIPTAVLPSFQFWSWTENRYNVTKAICNQYDIEFMDMEYESILDNIIDWKTDSCDGGSHLNVLGAKKVSLFLGKYLSDNYKIAGKYDDSWNHDLQIYEQIKSVGMLQLENNFSTYVSKLIKDEKDKTIFISSADDMSMGLNEQDILILQKLGLKLDLRKTTRYSYLAVIENAAVKYEGMTNEKISYTDRLSYAAVTYELVSGGYYVGARANIIVDGIDYAVGKRGMNIVVYDNKANTVLDSVCFDTCSLEHTAQRNWTIISKILREYENYIIETERIGN